MKVDGILSKMLGQHTTPVTYSLNLSNSSIELNPLLGKEIKFQFLDETYCIHCGEKIVGKSYEGYCKKDFFALPETDLCIVRPELCHFHLGTCRNSSWGNENCNIPHIVYLANSSGLKVGVTRKRNKINRWIDQGAIQGLPIIEVDKRLHAGIIEKEFARVVKDKTNWREMLKNIQEKIDLKRERELLFNKFGELLDDWEEEWGITNINLLENEEISEFVYPIQENSIKINSLTFDKMERVEGRLLGIKGQYLILDSGVINIRNHMGYRVSFSY